MVHVTFEVPMTVKRSVTVFWLATPCCLVDFFINSMEECITCIFRVFRFCSLKRRNNFFNMHAVKQHTGTRLLEFDCHCVLFCIEPLIWWPCGLVFLFGVPPLFFFFFWTRRLPWTENFVIPCTRCLKTV
jgi:hypothetical protein